MIHPVYFNKNGSGYKQEELVTIGRKRKISIKKEYGVQTRLRQSYERRLRSQMNRFFVEFFDDFATAFENEIDTTGLNIEYEQRLGLILENHYRTVIRVFGTRLLNQFTKNEEQFEIIYRDYARENVGQKITLISMATRKRIRRIIELNVNEGFGIAMLAKKIREDGKSGFSKYRSATIARTETHNAASFANHRIAQTQNLPNQKKRWLATQDERSSPSHLAVGGTTIPIEEDFIVGGARMGYAGDPRGGARNVINCRCVILYTSDLDEITS